MEEAALGLSSVKLVETPRVDAVVESFKDDVIYGNAYSRSKFIAQATTDILTSYAGSKDLGSLKAATASLARSELVRNDDRYDWGLVREGYYFHNKRLYSGELNYYQIVL